MRVTNNIFLPSWFECYHVNKGKIYLIVLHIYNEAQVRDVQMGVVLIDVIETEDVGMVDEFHYGNLSLNLWTGRKYWLPWYCTTHMLAQNQNHHSYSLF